MVTTRSIDGNSARIFFDKAKEFYEGMEEHFKQRKWNLVGLTGVHCVICAADGLLASRAGLKNTSQDHKSAVALLRKHIKDSEVIQQTKHFSKVIAKKNLVEYEGKVFYEKDAREIYTHAERFYRWASDLDK